MTDKPELLKTPVEPFRIEPGSDARSVLERMERISFQGRNLAAAHRLWQRMLRDRLTIFLGLAGALTAGGLRLAVAYLIERRYVDCLVSTGANLYHDLHEIRGRRHYVGWPRVDDARLQRERIDRVYDTFAREDEFAENDRWIADFALSLESRPYTTRELLYELGRRLDAETHADGILTAAARANVPIYCPAIADSSIGMGLSQARHVDAAAGRIDVIGDIIESANLVSRSAATASVVLGGGTPKNFINQASVQAEFFDSSVDGHRYALQIVTDAPHFGGASGSTLEEAQSWGKLAADAARVTVHADATLALPILASALATSVPDPRTQRDVPDIRICGSRLTIDGSPVPSNRYLEGE